MPANLDIFRFDDKVLSDGVLNTRVFDRDDEILGINKKMI